MSIRALLSTSTSALTSAVSGTVRLGNVLGEGTEWLARHAEQLNSKETIRKEELRRKQETSRELKEMFGGDSVEELKANIKEVEDFYDEIFK